MNFASDQTTWCQGLFSNHGINSSVSSPWLRDCHKTSWPAACVHNIIATVYQHKGLYLILAKTLKITCFLGFARFWLTYTINLYQSKYHRTVSISEVSGRLPCWMTAMSCTQHLEMFQGWIVRSNRQLWDPETCWGQETDGVDIMVATSTKTCSRVISWFQTSWTSIQSLQIWHMNWMHLYAESMFSYKTRFQWWHKWELCHTRRNSNKSLPV